MARSLPTLLLTFCLLALLAVTGCGGGGGKDEPALSPPSNLTVARDQDPWLILDFAWSRSKDGIDYYELEMDPGTGTFARAGGPIPGAYAISSLGPGTIVEGTDVRFRIRAVRGATPSAYSNTVPYHCGLNLPQVTGVTSGLTGITVTWVKDSYIADTLLLERGVTKDYGATFLWTPLPGPAFGLTSYLDTQAPENAEVAYRVTYSKGADQGSATSHYIHANLKSPLGLQAAGLAEGVRLSWQNTSPGALEVVVLRAAGLDSSPSFTEVAHLPATATAYSDLQLATGYYTYKVEARQGAGITAPSAPVQVVTLPLTTSPVVVTPAIVNLDEAAMAARDAQGGWFMARHLNESWSIQAPAGSAIPTFILPSAEALVGPSLVLDAQGHPHTVFRRTVVQASNEQALVHAWFDGAAWRTEEVARRTLTDPVLSPGVQFALDGTGTPHLIWAMSRSSSALEYAFKAPDGSWQVETLDVLRPALGNLYVMRLALDSNGTPAVYLYDGSKMFLLERQGPGQWRGETIPVGTLLGGYFGYSDLVRSRDGDLHLIFARQHQPIGSSFDLELCEIRKSGGAWTPVTTLVYLPSTSTLELGCIATSTLSDRIALSYSSSSGQRLLLYHQGTWSSSLLGPGCYTPVFMGFDAADQFSLLRPVNKSYPSLLYTYILYTGGR